MKIVSLNWFAAGWCAALAVVLAADGGSGLAVLNATFSVLNAAAAVWQLS
jgi:hypothetical protein